MLDADYRAPDDAYGTAWLQTFWERLSRKRNFFQMVTATTQAQTNARLFDKEAWLDELNAQTIQGYVFKIWLEGIRPPIWRRFLVPAGISFRQLHEIIQIVMGWENMHLYRFSVGDAAFLETPLGAGEYSAEESIDAYLKHVGTELFYEYDFGDVWGHLLKLEKYLRRGTVLPTCLAGKAACPPEDCGGLWVYKEFLRSRKKRSGRVSPKWQGQIGMYWDADAFDLGEINTKLKNL
jgi:hypothetical protein